MIRRLLAWIESKRNPPLDFGNYGIIARQSDGSYSALTNDQMRRMLVGTEIAIEETNRKVAEAEIAIENHWDDLFARAYCQYGEGIMATQ